MNGRPLRTAFESHIIRNLQALGLDIGVTTARNLLIVLCLGGIVPLTLVATVVVALVADGGRLSPIRVGGEAVGLPAAALTGWWLVQSLGERMRSSRWSRRPLGRREPALRYAQSAVGCDVRSVFLVEILLPGLVKLLPLGVFTVVVLVHQPGPVERLLVVASAAIGLMLQLDAARGALHQLDGTGVAPRLHLGPALSLPVVAVAGVVVGRLISSYDRPVPDFDLPTPLVAVAAVVSAATVLVQIWLLARRVASTEGQPLHPAAGTGGPSAGPKSTAPLRSERRQWATNFWRGPLWSGAVASRILIFGAAFAVTTPAVAAFVSHLHFAPIVAGFAMLSYLASACGSASGANLVTAGPSHRTLYELGHAQRFGFWLCAFAEMSRVLIPTAAMTLLWSALWPGTWYLPAVIASAAVSGCLLADALIGSTTNTRVSELQRVAFSSIVLGVAFLVWQVGMRGQPAALAIIAVVLLIGEELWAYKIQKLQLS